MAGASIVQRPILGWGLQTVPPLPSGEGPGVRARLTKT